MLIAIFLLYISFFLDRVAMSINELFFPHPPPHPLAHRLFFLPCFFLIQMFTFDPLLFFSHGFHNRKFSNVIVLRVCLCERKVVAGQEGKLGLLLRSLIAIQTTRDGAEISARKGKVRSRRDRKTNQKCLLGCLKSRHLLFWIDFFYFFFGRQNHKSFSFTVYRGQGL